MASALIKFCAVMVLVVVNAAEVSELEQVSEVCLACICQAKSGCKLDAGCKVDILQPTVNNFQPCGPFQITKVYWDDAGKPTLNGEAPDSPGAFFNCTNDPHCAALTVKGYMKAYPRDCNGDGLYNCYDYMAVHQLGPHACEGDLPTDYMSVFKQCMAAFAAQRL